MGIIILILLANIKRICKILDKLAIVILIWMLSIYLIIINNFLIW